jgi:cellulose synthase/poly-beta-1,6-N-acetylglucosamine synthase-like glycosyltransferase
MTGQKLAVPITAHTPSGSAPPARLEGLTVVLPCFDEAPNVAEAICEAACAAARRACAHQIVVVDDGSGDGTAVIACEVAREVPHVLVVRHDVISTELLVRAKVNGAAA